jgi:hypothetical protein
MLICDDCGKTFYRSDLEIANGFIIIDGLAYRDDSEICPYCGSYDYREYTPCYDDEDEDEQEDNNNV